MKRTPLYDVHLALGARMVEFGGWEMPVQYASILQEHKAVRTAAGLFDIDHMGQIEVQGPDSLPYLQRLVTNDIAAMQVAQAAYGLFLYPNGGIVDDIFTYRLTSRYVVAVNAANTAKDYAWMAEHTGDFDVTVSDISEATCMLALQGPKSEVILQGITPSSLHDLPYHRCLVNAVAGVQTLIGRTGYTGEDGFELYFPVQSARKMWEALMAAGTPHGMLPCGLGARDTLRFEAKMPLYGHEIGKDVNPLEAGLGWAVALEAPGKEKLIGREALLKVKEEGLRRRLVGFAMIERGIPRHGYEIAAGGAVVGAVTTGMYSPTLEKNLGLGYVPVEHARRGTEIEIIIRGRNLKATVVATPFYRRST